ncbi:hypothetical protein [Rhodoluna sp.]|uniref:hypothetical protein n=1 Tax=Rhodoluna sp. TaxID=1969481 RepID=UPI0025DD1B60|nr:hypothetical protein [Rhodoluna sp.]
MLARQEFTRSYIEAFQDAFDVQLAQIEKAELSPAVQRNALRNLALSLELHFVRRMRRLEKKDDGLKELRAVAELLMHVAKAPIALEFLRELASESFEELYEVFAV